MPFPDASAETIPWRDEPRARRAEQAAVLLARAGATYTPPGGRALPDHQVADGCHPGRPSFHHPGWVFEEKVDGWRVLAYKDAAGVRLVSRQGRDLTRRFPELAGAVGALEVPTLLLDGEIAVFDRQLLSRFEWFRAERCRLR